MDRKKESNTTIYLLNNDSVNVQRYILRLCTGSVDCASIIPDDPFSEYKKLLPCPICEVRYFCEKCSMYFEIHQKGCRADHFMTAYDLVNKVNFPKDKLYFIDLRQIDIDKLSKPYNVFRSAYEVDSFYDGYAAFSVNKTAKWCYETIKKKLETMPHDNLAVVAVSDMEWIIIESAP